MSLEKLHYLDLTFWNVIPAGGDEYEVRNGCEAFKVEEGLRTCTCRMWQISGLPCPHAIAVMFLINKSPVCSSMLQEANAPPCLPSPSKANG
ncbi:pentatricopeptide repeat-containing protein [Tanacetum coccineum]